MPAEWLVDYYDDLEFQHTVVADRELAQLHAAMLEWWQKLLDHAADAGDWDVIVADLSVESGRLIGHVQRADQPVGTDRGVRVCVRLAFPADDAEFIRLYDAARRAPATRARISELRAEPFSLWFCEEGLLTAEPALP